MASRLSCVLVGTESLLIGCAELWMERGHEVRAVLSTSPVITRWASAHDVPCVPPAADPPAALTVEPFDYLLSVTNSTYRPRDLRVSPRVMAISFHDGPLPSYGGFNATAWAIIDRERTHGVTWHEWGERLGAGDVLLQRVFDLTPRETTLTLNARCYEAALDAFGALVERLESGTVERRAQRPDSRTHYSRHARLRAAATLDWDRDGEWMDAHVRGLDFGPYPNPLGTPKVLLGQLVLTVGRLQLAGSRSGEPAGTILAIGGDALRVATTTRDITLSRLTSLDGEEQTASVWIQRAGLRVGDRLTSATRGTTERLSAVDADACRHEAYWTERLAQAEWLALPRVEGRGRAPGDGTEDSTNRDATVLSRREGVPDALRGTERVIAAAAAFLARAAGMRRFDIGFSEPSLRARVERLEPWFVDVVPLRVSVAPDQPLPALEQSLRAELARVREHATYARDVVLRRPELRDRRGAVRGARVVLVVGDPGADYRLPAGAEAALLIAADGGAVWWAARSADEAELLADQLTTMLRDAAASPHSPIGSLSLVVAGERHRILNEWNDTRTASTWLPCVHAQIEARVRRTPDATAVVCGSERITYRELDARANQLANHLRTVGVHRESLVAICMERSAEMVIALLGVLKAGGVLVPLDPALPHDRLAFVLQDSGAAVLLTEDALVDRLPAHAARIIRVDGERTAIAAASALPVNAGVTGEQLACVAYPPAPIGTACGVMVEHRNVTNLFAGLDAHIGEAERGGGVWLATASLSSDASLVELLWTLARGFTVVVPAGDLALSSGESDGDSERGGDAAMMLSLFCLGAGVPERAPHGYRLLLECARFADRHGFAAVWLPEQRGKPSGGFANPAVAGAAVAAATERVAIRAAGVAAPGRTVLRVLEDWAMVDNLSAGRVAIGLAAERESDEASSADGGIGRERGVGRDIEAVRRLWRGEAVRLGEGDGTDADVRAVTRPVQPDVPVWVAAAEDADGFREAGALGANVLTHLRAQSLDDLAGKITAYRAARAEHGHAAGSGQVTVVLPAFLGESGEDVRAHVRDPLAAHLRRSPELAGQPAAELDAALARAVERCWEAGGLFGTPEQCTTLVARLRQIGVTEIACLVDFGVNTEAVLEHLRYLDELRRRVMGRPAGREDSLPVLIARHGATHMHCTPALAATLAGSEAGRAALRRMRTLVVSGAALTRELADALRSQVGSEAGGAPGTRGGRVLNMFGVGETTVWSTTHELTDSSDRVPIGRPLANVLCYVLDAERSPVPVGTTGELYIGGAGVARGYLHRTELTAERFVANPFATPGRDDAGDGGRLHRTGHLVRWRADGVLEHMGRTDDAHAQSSDARPRPELPADDLEASMCEVWREVLGLGEVGATDDFFALGGHSLLALRVHNRLRESLQLRVSLVDLFRHPTVRSLARAVRGAESPGPQLPGGILPLTRDASRVR